MEQPELVMKFLTVLGAIMMPGILRMISVCRRSKQGRFECFAACGIHDLAEMHLALSSYTRKTLETHCT